MTDGPELPVKHVWLEYPRSSITKTIEVGLCCVRAADSIRITYDFDRDGWSISQQAQPEDPSNPPAGWEYDPDANWAEVAFVQAWARTL